MIVPPKSGIMTFVLSSVNIVWYSRNDNALSKVRSHMRHVTMQLNIRKRTRTYTAGHLFRRPSVHRP